MKLNLGCGRTKLVDCLNVDLSGGELRADAHRLPFKDNSFNEVRCYHSMEHFKDINMAIREIHRVLQIGGNLKIVVPYGLKPLCNPVHYHAFRLNSMKIWCMKRPSLETDRLFNMIKAEISNYKIPFRWHLAKHLKLGNVGEDNRVRFPFPLGPRDEITFILKKVEIRASEAQSEVT